MPAILTGMKRPAITQHYEQLIGLRAPWRVESVELSHEDQEVRIRVAAKERPKLRCPECGRVCGRYDARERRWRHLDTMQYRTILIASVPRANCETHGVRQIEVPWSEPGGRFTSLFEALAIDWLLDASISAVAAQLGLTWDQVAGIQQRAVERGFRRRRRCPPYQIGVDETSFARRHEYVTVVSDLEDGCVLHVGDDHRRDTLEAYYKGLGSRVCANLDVVVMDMWGPYVNATKTYVPDAESRIVFDKFHIAKNLGDAVDQVRKKENRGLRERGDTRLVGTKYLWLRNPHKMNRSQLLDFGRLRYSRLKVARAWAMKEAAMSL